MTRLRSIFSVTPFIAPFFLTCILTAQPPAAQTVFQQKIQALQQASIRNEEQLSIYQWIETTTVTVDGNPKPPRQSLCRYTPEGTVAKTPIGPQPEASQPSGGPLKRRIMEKKIEEVQQDAAEVRGLAALYLPVRPGSLKQALETRRIEFEHAWPGSNTVIINDYLKPGDQLTLELDSAGVQLRRITVKTYFASSPKEILTASVNFAALEDGTTYPSVTSLNAPSKKLAIATVSSNFSRAIQ